MVETTAAKVENLRIEYICIEWEYRRVKKTLAYFKMLCNIKGCLFFAAQPDLNTNFYYVYLDIGAHRLISYVQIMPNVTKLFLL